MGIQRSDRAYVCVRPLNGPPAELTDGERKGLAKAFGIQATVRQVDGDGSVLFGFAWTDVPDQAMARRGVEKALRMTLGDDWAIRFEVVER